MSVMSDTDTDISMAPSQTVISVEEYIKILCLGIVEAVNNRSMRDSPAFQHIAQDVKVSHEAEDASFFGRGRDRFIDGLTSAVQDNPDFVTQVQSIEVTVNNTGNVARAWVLRSCSGLKSGRHLEVIASFTYELENGDWFLTEYKGIRNFSVFTHDTLFGF